MADNTNLNPGTGGDTIRTVDRTTSKTQVVQLDWGGDTGSGNEQLGTLTNSFPTGIAASYFNVSTNNSSTAQLGAGQKFTGVIETTLNTPLVSFLLTSDQPVIVTLNQYIDIAGLYPLTPLTWTIPAGQSFNRSITVNGNYINLTVQNIGQSTTTTFNLNTAYGFEEPVTSLGNQPVEIVAINGSQFSGGSVPVTVGNTISVSDPTVDASLSSDTPLFNAVTGDPSGDWKNVDFFDALFNPANGLSISANVINQPKVDTSQVGSNGGVLPADGQGPWILNSGSTEIIDTLGYQSAIIHSILGTVTVSLSNSAGGPWVNVTNMQTIGFYGLSNQVLGGGIGVLPLTSRWIKLSLPVGTGNYAITYLRQDQPTNTISGQGAPINIVGINGSTTASGGSVSGTFGVGGVLAEASVANNVNPILTAGVVRTATVTSAAGAVMRNTFSSGGAMVVFPYSVPDACWQYTTGLAGLTTTTLTPMSAAGAAGIRNYCTGIQVVNASTTVGTTISILDGSTVIWAGNVDEATATLQAGLLDITFPTPLKGTAATAMNVQLGTTGSLVMINAQGFQAP